MIVRKARLKDVPALVELWKVFMKEHDKIVLRKNPKAKTHLRRKKDATDIFKKFAPRCIRSKNAAVYIAEVDGKPAGYCLIGIKKNTPVYIIEKYGHINDLFVKKEFRRMGISSGFRDAAIKWFKKKGVKYMYLDVNAENEHAHMVYKKWGFFDFDIDMRRKV